MPTTTRPRSLFTDRKAKQREIDEHWKLERERARVQNAAKTERLKALRLAKEAADKAAAASGAPKPKPRKPAKAPSRVANLTKSMKAPARAARAKV